MNTKQYTNSNFVGGIALIALGLIFFAATQGVFNLDWGNIWPAFVMLPGVIAIGQAFTVQDSRRRAGQVLGGMIPLLLGAYFFAATTGVLSWSLWPVYPLIVGVAFFAAYITSGFEESRYLIPGLVLSAAGVVFLGMALLGDYGIIGKIWPIFLIIGGLLLLVFPRVDRDKA